MKFIYYPYDLKCNFLPDLMNRITIEDKQVFEEFLVNLEKNIQKEEESFYVEENDKEINLEKSTVLISSPLDLKYNKKEFQKALYNKLVEEIQIHEMQEKLSEYHATLIEEIDALRMKMHFDLEFDEEMNYHAIFKMLDVSLEQPQGNFIEKLLDYMATEVELMNKKIFVIANCSAFIKERWYDEIVKWGEYQNVIIIFVDNQQVIVDKNINEYILDKDICEIH